MDATGTLSLDSKLADCQVGVEKQLTVTVMPVKNGDSGFEADVTGLEEYSEESPDTSTDTTDTGEGESAAAGDMNKGGSPGKGTVPSHVIMIGIGQAKKPKK